MPREYLKDGECIELFAEQQTDRSETWRIVSKVGEGASAVCYEAIHNNKKGKLKCFDPLQKDIDYLTSGEQFLKPYTLLEEIKHKDSKNELLNNYIPYYEILRDQPDGGKIYIWTPSDKQGDVFSKYLQEVRKDPLQDAEKKCNNIIQTMISVSDCICLLHSAGLLHLDIKPSNILVCHDSAGEINAGNISLFDIDTVCTADSVNNGCSGTKGFCAPEIFMGKADWRSDIYSIGAMLYNAIIVIDGTGNGTFSDEYYSEIDSLINSSKLINALEIPEKAAFKAVLGNILRKTLARNANRRYDTCEDLMQELKRIKAYIDAVNLPVQKQEAKDDGTSRSHVISKQKIVLLAVIAVIIAVIAIWFGNRQNIRGILGNNKVADEVGIGALVCFGKYEQDSDSDNGPEDIVWQVLDISDGRALLISRLALDCKAYNDAYAGIHSATDWKSSKLRKWLNGDFYSMAFSEDEKSQIVATEIAPGENSLYGTKYSNVVSDKVFILSEEEFKEYGYYIDGAVYNIKNMIGVSMFALNKGIEVAQQADYKEYYELVPEEMVGSCKWWLRTPGETMGKVAYVQPIGTVAYKGTDSAQCKIGVRPAVWVSYEAIAGNGVPSEAKLAEKSDYVVRTDEINVSHAGSSAGSEDVGWKHEENVADDMETLLMREEESIIENGEYNLLSKTKVVDEYGLSGSYSILNNLIERQSITANDIGMHYDFEGGNQETVDNLFDGNLLTKYCAVNGNTVDGTAIFEVHFTLTRKAAVKGYVLFTANDTMIFDTRNPDSWEIYGSNDSSAVADDSWHLIQKESGEDMRPVDFTGFGYAVDNAEEYKYYKIVFCEAIEFTHTIQLADILILGE